MYVLPMPTNVTLNRLDCNVPTSRNAVFDRHMEIKVD